MGERNRRKPIENRETIEIDGVPQRLSWVAENRPEILMKRILGAHHRTDAYWAAFKKAGIDRQEAVRRSFNEWGLDANILGHLRDHYIDH